MFDDKTHMPFLYSKTKKSKKCAAPQRIFLLFFENTFFAPIFTLFTGDFPKKSSDVIFVDFFPLFARFG